MGQVELIAELSCNHLGLLDRAHRLIDAAAESGATAVKFQHDPPDGGLTLDCDRPEFTIRSGPWAGRRMADLYRETWTPWEWTDELATHAKSRGLEWVSTPGSVEAVEFLEKHGATRYKIGSFDVTDVELLQAIAATGKPVMVSLGCATEADIWRVATLFSWRVTFMHCVSQYPTPVEYANLGSLEEILAEYIYCGLSDHSMGAMVPLLAVALGAVAIEKHLTISREDGGPDAGFSMEPKEFRMMADRVRQAEEAMRLRETVPDWTFCKSIYVVADVKAGEVFTRENVRAIRPGYGLAPAELPNVLGRQARRDIVRGEPVAWEMLA